MNHWALCNTISSSSACYLSLSWYQRPTTGQLLLRSLLSISSALFFLPLYHHLWGKYFFLDPSSLPIPSEVCPWDSSYHHQQFPLQVSVLYLYHQMKVYALSKDHQPQNFGLLEILSRHLEWSPSTFKIQIAR